MDTKKLPYKCYWSSSLEMRDDFISRIMSSKRFVFFLGNFHVNDNSAMSGKKDLDYVDYDKLYKSFVENAVTNFSPVL